MDSLFVGAPQFSNGTGNVYRCTKSSTEHQTVPCTPLQINNYQANTKLGWLGASMATGENSDFTVISAYLHVFVVVTFHGFSKSTYFFYLFPSPRPKVCAPRTIVPYKMPRENFYFNDLHGVCYYILGGNGNILSRDTDANKKPYQGISCE